MASTKQPPPPAPPEEEDDLWTAADVARYLKVKRTWVYRAAADERIPSTRKAGLLRFVPSEIRALRDPARPSAAVIPLGPSR